MSEKLEQDLAITPYVFVYGTLKRGYGNNRLLAQSRFIGECVTQDSFYEMYDCGFPYLLRKEKGYKAKGEVYQVSVKALQDLDWLEGVDNGHYERVLTEVVFCGEPLTVWVYQLPEDEHFYVSTRLPPCKNEEGILVW